MISEIKDTRPASEFKVITLSNYKKTDVKNALIDSMMREKIENACHWSAELICSGHFSEVWEMILLFFSKNIYLGNPKIPLYLKRRYQLFRGVMNNKLFVNEMELRNSDIIRKLFAEIICILTFSKKKNSFEYMKIDREEEFDMTKNGDRMKAPTLEYANKVMKPEDPKELSIAINELIYSLSVKDNKYSCYWVDWVIEFDTICRTRKEPCLCFKRDEYPVEKKFKKDIIWLVWESIIHQSEDYSEFMRETIQALFELFCIKYTSSTGKKRRYILYYAISVLIEPFDINIPLIEDKVLVEFYKDKINEVYKQIKKNEIVDPNFKSDKEKNLNKSIDKIKLLSQIDNFMPQQFNEEN
jgi:hypothetical protein